jgi:hypothetical protein
MSPLVNPLPMVDPAARLCYSWPTSPNLSPGHFCYRTSAEKVQLNDESALRMNAGISREPSRLANVLILKTAKAGRHHATAAEVADRFTRIGTVDDCRTWPSLRR